MQNNLTKNNSFLGHKRNSEEIKKEENMANKEEKQNKKLILKRPELNDVNNHEKNEIYLNEEKVETKHNIDLINNQCKTFLQTPIILNQNEIYEKCGHEKNVVNFNYFKDSLDYFNNNDVRALSKHSVLFRNCLNKEDEKSLPICRDRLLEVSNNENVCEKFISRNVINYFGNNENPFKNFYESSCLKHFNNKEKKDNNNNKNILSLSDEKKNEFIGSKSIFKRMNTIENESINYDLNGTSKGFNHYNNKFQNINSKNGNIKNINKQFLQSNNYKGSSEEKCSNIILPNNFNNKNNSHNLIIQNKNYQNIGLPDKNNINQSLAVKYFILNDPDFLQISLLNQPECFIPFNNISNIYDSQFFQIDNFKDKNINKKTNMVTNNNKEEKTTDEKHQKDDYNIQNCINNKDKGLNKNDKMIENKDFDDIFQLARSLYHKLLDIKIKRNLDINLTKLNQDNQNILLNFFDLNSGNDNFINGNENLDVNQISKNIFDELYLNNLDISNNSDNKYNKSDNFINNSYQNNTYTNCK